MKDTTIIKRYQNRKLYDTNQSCYITLDELMGIVRDGNQVQVIDNKTKQDITDKTLCGAALQDTDLKSAVSNFIQQNDLLSLVYLINTASGGAQNSGGNNE